MSDDYRQLIRDNILGEKTTFVRARFSGQKRGEATPWLKVELRPVEIKGRPQLQFSYFESNKNIVKNYPGAEAEAKLEQALALPFKNYYVETVGGSLHVQITKKGKAIIRRGPTAGPPQAPNLAHDRRKARLLPADQADPFLQAVGLMTQNGKIKAGMQRKYRQINKFLEILDQTIQPQKLELAGLKVADFGCGNAYLTFATYHYFNHLLDIPTELVGLDLKSDLLQQHARRCQALGWDKMTFQSARIIDFQPAAPADIVLALHACDTATDEALAQAIRMQSRFVFSAPCCHHHLQQQLERRPPPPGWRALFRDGILKEHLGDTLTDAFRATLLRVMGYKTDVIEFVASEHTPKNLMIRAVKSTAPGDPGAIQEYQDLKAFWQVTPYLEELLAEELAALSIHS
jgi:SAM-dependent methyltransferase